MASYKHPSFNHPSSPSSSSVIALCSEGSYRLQDFQWRFAVTTKHSLVAHTDCLVQLRLLLASRSGDSRRTVQLELSMGEFNEFFREMEKIANTLAIIN